VTSEGSQGLTLTNLRSLGVPNFNAIKINTTASLCGHFQSITLHCCVVLCYHPAVFYFFTACMHNMVHHRSRVATNIPVETSHLVLMTL